MSRVILSASTCITEEYIHLCTKIALECLTVYVLLSMATELL